MSYSTTRSDDHVGSGGFPESAAVGGDVQSNNVPVGSGQHGTTGTAHTDDQEHKVGFKAQVEGYAKKFAGKTFGKEHEVAAGEARLRGEDEPKHHSDSS